LVALAAVGEANEVAGGEAEDELEPQPAQHNIAARSANPAPGSVLTPALQLMPPPHLF
jgi:hypothetical protein